MVEIDVLTVGYDVELFTENGSRYLLNDALTGLQWEEHKSELAQRVNITFGNADIEGGSKLASLIKLNCGILIYGKWNEAREVVFEGTIWEWGYAAGTQKEVSITAYDPLIRLQQSKDFKYYSAGMTTGALIGDICDEWGIPLAYRWEKSITHTKRAFSGERISDMIFSLLEEVRQKTGEKYIAYYRAKQLQIVGYGVNSTVYLFDGENTEMTSDKLSLNSLVTRVKVIVKQDSEGRVPVESVVDGDTRFGVLQEIVRRDGDKTLEAAISEANALIQERGKPEETIQIDVPDLPFLRKGDKVEIRVENLDGFFITEGVSHNATDRRMTLTLARAAQSAANEAEPPHKAGVFAKGDAVILNGPVYVDSYGNGKGKTFKDYRSTITIVAPLNHPCPYHIGAVGWVYPDEITRG